MKFTRIQRAVPSGPSAPPRPKSAQEAAIEKRLTGYIPLICGHITTWQEDELYRGFGLPRDKHYCETCGKPVKARKIKPAPMPDEPMF